MTSTYDTRGRRVGATIVEVAPNAVTQVKTAGGKDGYNAVQIGVGTKKSVRKPQIGHAKKAGLDSKIRWFREVRTEETAIEPGTEIKLNQVFSIGDTIKVTGVSKGKGFQGGVRRHGFAGGPKTHGQSDRHRAPGSIGSGTTPGRVYKGKHMAGHMGVDQVTVTNLEVVGLNKNENLLIVKGGLPGPVGSLLKIEKVGQVKGYVPQEEPEEVAETEEPVENTEAVAEEAQPEVAEAVSTEETSTEEVASEESAPAEETAAEESAASEEAGSAESSSEPQEGEENAS